MKFNIKLIFAVIIGLVALLSVSLAATSQPGFCNSCHEMKNDYQAWKASAHKDVSCTSCHIEPGIVNFLHHKVVALNEVVAHIRGSFETPINKGSALSEKMSPLLCTSCHESPGKESNERLKFDHTLHSKTGFNCTYCHNRVGHPGMEEYESRINMPFCINCHKKEDGPTRCSVCHPSEFELKPASHTGGKWLKTHGKDDTSECSNCHFDEKSFCMDCHGLPMPHEKGWRTAHGKDKSLLETCEKCHDKPRDCTACHDLK